MAADPAVLDGARGNAAMGATRKGGLEHVRLVDVSSIQSCTASAAQPDGSVVTTLCPTPGTTTSLPCGNCATTDCAPSVGVRMSKPPLSARTGTFGYAAGDRFTPPDGVGQVSHRLAFPRSAAQVPNGPNVPGGSAAIALRRRPGRADGAESAGHGNGPSRQSVAA